MITEREKALADLQRAHSPDRSQGAQEAAPSAPLHEAPRIPNLKSMMPKSYAPRRWPALSARPCWPDTRYGVER